MKNIKKVLVPTDFSDSAMHAYRYAIWFADHYDAEIRLIHLIPPEVVPMDLPVMSAKLTKQRADSAKEVMKVFVDSGLVQAQTGHELRKVPQITSEILIGMAMDLITDVAQRDDFDLIIMGTRGERNALNTWFGTTTSNTVNKAPCPVLVIPNETHFESISHIAYATDLSASDPEHIWDVGSLFSRFNPKLMVLHVSEEEDSTKALSMDNLKAYFADRAPAYPISFHVLHDDDEPAESIEDFVEDEKVDLLIMYRPRRNFIQKIFHRSLTRATVLHTEVPLLVLK